MKENNIYLMTCRCELFSTKLNTTESSRKDNSTESSRKNDSSKIKRKGFLLYVNINRSRSLLKYVSPRLKCDLSSILRDQ